ncbi:CHAP domain-containing protein [Bacillus aerolatus]|uniref:CHAP domain-containing protein n=1 Tax=Bacillus aerolatus TaxID=2653354 RepID=A0A6I1FS21_9BACI|nr:amidase domain-containing protein [Bacillus aerolatus]KAB7704889.1 CHAP domain-containing protein [Bacillus aerolatus]
MYEELRDGLERRLQLLVEDRVDGDDEKFLRKKRLTELRNSKIVKAKAFGKVLFDDGEQMRYLVHYKYLIKQGEFIYLEEEVEERAARIENKEVIEDKEAESPSLVSTEWNDFAEAAEEFEERRIFHYDRLKAVQYAERWWNSNNPAYRNFDVNCTNYISQCLHAGGAPMTGYPDRSRGWWIRGNNWSYSWSVAHAFRWFLSSAQTGLRAEEVNEPENLQPGDVICYDFQGDGRFDHTTIVTAKDRRGMPLVNAHTTNSRMRYWSYEDSTAYTANIKYKFFQIKDDSS